MSTRIEGLSTEEGAGGEPAPGGAAAQSGTHTASHAASGQQLAGSPDASPRDSGAELAPGTLLDGAYRVERCIGRGAMGAIYQVEHVALGRKFAAKVVSHLRSADGNALLRLRNEARAASAIEHENIVDVTHLGRTDDGSLFVVMELLRGEDLREWLDAQRRAHAEGGGPPWLPDAEVRDIVAQVSSALGAAHAAGIVHRDLKPENVFLAEKGERVVAKIVDFGISKLQHGPDDLRLTATGQIIGTPLYMAPEQSRDTGEVDGRADVYSMGVMAYEMVTGTLPFSANGIYETIVQHASVPPPPPREHRPELPEAVERVILRCLEKRPEDRYATAEQALAAWHAAWDEGARSVGAEVEIRPRARRPAIWAFAALAALSLVAGGWLALAPSRDRLEPPAGRSPEGLAEGVRVEERGPLVVQPSSPAPAPRPDPPPEIERLVRSAPAGAEVFAGGRSLGTTPVRVRFAPDERIEIEVVLPGHHPERRVITEASPPEIEVRARRRRPQRPSGSPPPLAPQ